MRDENEGMLARISDQLSQLTRLIALSMTADKKQRDQISILSRAGLDRNEIANILRTTPGTVSVELSILKKMGKRRE
jgi:DNA-binding NarL/FixJ family response regulator